MQHISQIPRQTRKTIMTRLHRLGLLHCHPTLQARMRPLTLIFLMTYQIHPLYRTPTINTRDGNIRTDSLMPGNLLPNCLSPTRLISLALDRLE